MINLPSYASGDYVVLKRLPPGVNLWIITATTTTIIQPTTVDSSELTYLGSLGHVTCATLPDGDEVIIRSRAVFDVEVDHARATGGVVVTETTLHGAEPSTAYFVGRRAHPGTWVRKSSAMRRLMAVRS